jgi:cytochrome c oxidase cbb3-type subunit 2
MRTGPDLWNIGARQPSRGWHLTHLYNPRLVAPKSVMPPFPWLFKEVGGGRWAVGSAGPNDVAVEGTNVIATREALDLVEYLTGLNHTYRVKP